MFLEVFEALRICDLSFGLFEQSPVRVFPRATMQAPVRVARSIIASGLYFLTPYARASARIRRPSASVLVISMVFPLYALIMSPGL